MPYSEFVRLLKAAVMLEARERLAMINVANFAQLKESVREEFGRNLRSAASQYVTKEVKDYKQVLANIARGLSGIG